MKNLVNNCYVAPSAALLAATGIHVLLAAALLHTFPVETILPSAVGGFEVVDLSAFGETAVAEPERPKDTPEEKIAKKLITEPVTERKHEPEFRAEEKPVAVPPPKPVVKSEPEAKSVQKAPTEPPSPQEQQQPTTVSTGSQNAFVPPQSRAAYLRNPKPSYPATAQQRGMQGVVVLAVSVSMDGLPLSVSIKASSGYTVLDKAALKAVSAWRFAPATQGGRAVEAQVDVPIRFSLNDT